MKGDALLNFVEQTYVDIQHEVTDDPIEWKLRTGSIERKLVHIFVVLDALSSILTSIRDRKIN